MLEGRIKTGNCITVVSATIYILVFTGELIITVRRLNAPLALEFQMCYLHFRIRSANISSYWI
jgi:hypothetical protein